MQLGKHGDILGNFANQLRICRELDRCGLFVPRSGAGLLSHYRGIYTANDFRVAPCCTPPSVTVDPNFGCIILYDIL
jgi:hypothetical protein